MRLRGQYTSVIGGLVCASLLVLGGALLAEQRRYAQEVDAVASVNLADTLQRQIEKHGIALATSLAHRIETSLATEQYADILSEAAEQRSYKDVIGAFAVDAQGRAIREDGVEQEISDRANVPWVREALSSGKPASLRDGSTLHAAAPVISGERVLGAAVVEIAMDGIRSDIQIEQSRLDGLIRTQATAFTFTGLALGIVLVTISVMAAIGVAGGLSRPVVAFASRARRIGRGELVEATRLDRRDEIGDLSRAFDEMAGALRETTVSKEYFDNVLRSMADMLLVTDASGRVVTANPRCLSELGCDEERLRGTPIESLLPALATSLEGPMRGEASSTQPFDLERPSGGTIPVRVSGAPLREENGFPSGYVFVMQNIADRIASARQIERSLAEKEILLREIHHRVKNNLQIISSMLSLQADRSDDRETRQVFHESEVRIRAMALVHEQLYRSGDLARVDLARYLETLSQQVLRSLGPGDVRITVEVDEAVRDVTVDEAIPIGLITNELIANAVKHGLARAAAGRIDVRLTGDGAARRLVVADNGSGFPAGFDVDALDTLGLKLVQALTEQLGGRFTMTSDGGARCVVEFPGPAAASSADAPRADVPDRIAS